MNIFKTFDITRGEDGSKKLNKIYQIVGRLRGDCQNYSRCVKISKPCCDMHKRCTLQNFDILGINSCTIHALVFNTCASY
jgi:hypothetical protein